MDTDAIINRRSPIRIPELQKKVAAAKMHLGDHSGARHIMAREPIVLPDGTLKANLDFGDIIMNPPKGVGSPGDPDHQPVVEVDGGQFVALNNGGRGFLVSYQSSSYERLTEHLGDYEDDPDAHDEIYDELGNTYREAIVESADYLLAPHRRNVLPRQYVRDLEVLKTTMQNEEPSIWEISDVVKEKTAFYSIYPGEIWLDAVVVDAGVFEDWANGVLGI